MNKMFIFLLFILYVAACRSESFVAVNQDTANQGAISISNFSNTAKAAIDSTPTKTASYGEITNCAPEKFGRGAKLVISLKTPSGGNLAIVRDKSKDGFFLLSDENESKQSPKENLFWTIDDLKKMAEIEINTAAATAVDLTKLNSQGEGKPELIFSRKGWYAIEISNESLEQDDPPLTGRCRVYFSGNSALQTKTVGSEVLFDFRKEFLSEEPKTNVAERARVLLAAQAGEEADAVEISSREVGGFTAANQNQTAYLIRPDVTSITQNPTNPSKSILAIFEGEKLIAKFDAGSYFYIAAKSDANRDGVNEILLVGENLQMGIKTKWAKLISVSQNKLQVVKDFKTVYENTCEGALVKNKKIHAAVVKYEFTQNQSSPVFSSQNLVLPCSQCVLQNRAGI